MGRHFSKLENVFCVIFAENNSVNALVPIYRGREKSGNANQFAIVAAIGAAVKQKFTPDAPYGIDSRYYFEVISLLPKAQESRRAAVPF
jgi:hypothetical protein